MDCLLLYGEAEAYIHGLERGALRDIGCPKWLRQHEYIEKLNMQAILHGRSNQDEFIKDLFVSLGKIPMLVHEMILVEVWKQNVFPKICEIEGITPKTLFLLYIVIHHEATIINLLETILYYKESCEAAEDAVVDLIDYCHRKLSLLAEHCDRGEIPTEERNAYTDVSNINFVQDLHNQTTVLEFEISLKTLSVLCYITDHVESLSSSVLTRLLDTHNMPHVLVQLIQHCPWSRISGGKVQKYEGGKWCEIPAEDMLKMTKLEGQVWIALLNLLLKPACQRKYDYSFNRTQLLKLCGLLTEVVIDQLPQLADLQRFLIQLAVTDPEPPKKTLVLEQLPEIWNKIVKENAGKWKAIAKHQVKMVFDPSDSELREQANRLAETYNLNVMESLTLDEPKCGVCGALAAKRCSWCQGEWYCNIQCQVKGWPKHKHTCQLIAETTERAEHQEPEHCEKPQETTHLAIPGKRRHTQHRDL